MGQLIPDGERVSSRSNTVYEVKKKINEGGQAEIYLVDSGNRSYVLKVYHKGQGTIQQKKILERLLDLKPPSRSFVWPIDLVDLKKFGTIGYTMPYIDTNTYSTLCELLYEEIDKPEIYRDIIAAYLLSDSFFRLHIRGLLHADISATNVWINRENGDIRIFDCDNIIFSNEQSSVGGTLPFKAPEIIREELDSGISSPSAYTDRHSLAVTLFIVLFHHHPLKGEKEIEYGVSNEHTKVKLYGEHPVFIYDPHDASNRPNPEFHATVDYYWSKYPEFIKNLFITTFTEGLKDPKNGRTGEIIWRKNLLKLRDSIMLCSNCKAENFIYSGNGRNSGKKEYMCWFCDKTQKVPPQLTISGRGISHTINLNEGTYLYKTHIDNSYNIEEKVGLVEVRSKGDPITLGLKNISTSEWKYSIGNSELRIIPPQKGIIVKQGITIQFPGGVIGKFVT